MKFTGLVYLGLERPNIIFSCNDVTSSLIDIDNYLVLMMSCCGAISSGMTHETKRSLNNDKHKCLGQKEQKRGRARKSSFLKRPIFSLFFSDNFLLVNILSLHVEQKWLSF